jgi:hypothetical protein
MGRGRRCLGGCRPRCRPGARVVAGWGVFRGWPGKRARAWRRGRRWVGRVGCHLVRRPGAWTGRVGSESGLRHPTMRAGGPGRSRAAKTGMRARARSWRPGLARGVSLDGDMGLGLNVGGDVLECAGADGLGGPGPWPEAAASEPGLGVRSAGSAGPGRGAGRRWRRRGHGPVVGEVSVPARAEDESSARGHAAREAGTDVADHKNPELEPPGPDVTALGACGPDPHEHRGQILPPTRRDPGGCLAPEQAASRPCGSVRPTGRCSGATPPSPSLPERTVGIPPASHPGTGGRAPLSVAQAVPAGHGCPPSPVQPGGPTARTAPASARLPVGWLPQHGEPAFVSRVPPPRRRPSAFHAAARRTFRAASRPPPATHPPTRLCGCSGRRRPR